MRINLFNSKNPNGIRIPVTVNIVHSDIVETQDGDPVYLITLSTGVRDVDDIIINNVTKANIKSQLSKGLADIAEQIDWGSLEQDTKAPFIKTLNPSPGQEDVNLNSRVNIRLRDSFPATGIDPSTIKLYVNDIDITSELDIKEQEFEIAISWKPTVVS